jgi:hypothetical protein
MSDYRSLHLSADLEHCRLSCLSFNFTLMMHRTQKGVEIIESTLKKMTSHLLFISSGQLMTNLLFGT